jgi:uncharacterized protein
MTAEPTAQVTVHNNVPASRYEAEVDGQPAGFAAYRLAGDGVVFTHTEVADAWEGRGVASALARWALDDVAASGRAIAPRCPFIAAYIRRHPEYVAHVDAEHRPRFTG